jgi:YD repeat-containing protein
VASPDRGTTVNVYDARGLITQRTDARGIDTNLTDDNAGRLTAKAYPASGGAYYATYTWDVSAPDNKGIGRLTGISDESGITWRPYDAQGRVTIDCPAPALATQYTYDAAGKVTSMTYPSGRIVDFTRDALGNISNIYTRRMPGLRRGRWFTVSPAIRSGR